MKNVYLSGPTAYEIWNRIRCLQAPRLDRLAPVEHHLAPRLGIAPARITSLATDVRDTSGLVSLLGAKLAAISPQAPVPTGNHDKAGDAVRLSSRPSRPNQSGNTDIQMSPFRSGPIELLVPQGNDRRRSSVRTCRTWSHPVPPHSFFSMGNGVFVSSPEFLFLQFATRMTLVELVLLGYEMCGAYASERFGLQPATRCQPMTSTKEIARFLDRVPGMPGAKRARRTLELVADRSASAGETAAVVLATMPRRLGGYGLPLPCMNHRIGVPHDLHELLARSEIILDAYWPDAACALEYNGAEHDGVEASAYDHYRRNCLTLLRISVDTITRVELFREALFDKAVRRVAKKLRYRLFSRDFGTQWHRKRDELRREVFGQLFPRRDGDDRSLDAPVSGGMDQTQRDSAAD